MRERKISYSKEMVLAKLAGKKTQTRRVVVPQPLFNAVHCAWHPKTNAWYWHRHDGRNVGLPQSCPFGVPGDRLWIQEGYQITEYDPGDETMEVSGYYLADGMAFRNIPLTEKEWAKLDGRKYPHRATPGRFMYKSLSRMKDEIVEVRGEQVQSIREEDARDEGYPFGLSKDDMSSCLLAMSLHPEQWPGIHRTAFARYWQKLNGKPRKNGVDISWDSNCWVWILTTRRIET